MTGPAAPDQLTELGLDRLKFSKSDNKSWRGPCPKCGGSRRFVIFTNNEFPLWFGFCDECGYREKFWEKCKHQLTPEEKSRYMAVAEQAERERAEYRREKLAEFGTAEIWQELHERMTEDNYSWWDKQGVPKGWADFWRLGYQPQKTFEHNGELFTRAAYTIPKFSLGWKPVNIDYRIVDPPPGVGKYRPAPGLAAAAFLSRPERTWFDDEVIVVEGSKKAMVVCVYGTEDGKMQVVGIPGCSSWVGIDKILSACKRVYIALDPDAQAWAHKLAAAVGQAARLISLPVKPDDAFIEYGMTRREWQGQLRQAVKL